MPSGLDPTTTTTTTTTGPDRYGWMMCSALVMSPPLNSVASQAGVSTTATTGRMSQWSVTVSVSICTLYTLIIIIIIITLYSNCTLQGVYTVLRLITV